MFTATITVDFCAAHRLLNHTGKCAYLHGHNYKARLTFRRKDKLVNDLGFVEDFAILKKHIKEWIDQYWDHNVILHPQDPLIQFLISGKGHATRIPYCIPNNANPTAENIAKELFKAALLIFGTMEIVKLVGVEISETDGNSATYSEEY